MLTKIFQKCLNGEDTPEEWRSAYLTPIYKEGGQNVPGNYRGITAIPLIGRIYSKVHTNILEKEIKNKQPEEQASFRAGRSTIDNIEYTP